MSLRPGGGESSWRSDAKEAGSLGRVPAAPHSPPPRGAHPPWHSAELCFLMSLRWHHLATAAGPIPGPFSPALSLRTPSLGLQCPLLACFRTTARVHVGTRLEGCSGQTVTQT